MFLTDIEDRFARITLPQDANLLYKSYSATAFIQAPLVPAHAITLSGSKERGHVADFPAESN